MVFDFLLRGQLAFMLSRFSVLEHEEVVFNKRAGHECKCATSYNILATSIKPIRMSLQVEKDAAVVFVFKRSEWSLYLASDVLTICLQAGNFEQFVYFVFD